MGDVELVGDLPKGEVTPEQAQHLELAFGQRFHVDGAGRSPLWAPQRQLAFGGCNEVDDAAPALGAIDQGPGLADEGPLLGVVGEGVGEGQASVCDEDRLHPHAGHVQAGADVGGCFLPTPTGEGHLSEGVVRRHAVGVVGPDLELGK